MNILVISNNYPTKAFPNYGAFVYNLMQELSKQHQIMVISPFKIHNLFKPKGNTYGDEKCRILRPLYLSLSNKKIGSRNTGELTAYFFRKAIQRTLNRIPYKPDIIYTHFLNNAIPIVDYAKDYKIPLIIASGESNYTFWNSIKSDIQINLINQVNQIICVSPQNKERLVSLGFTPEKITVVPNAVNYSLFKPLNKNASKEKLGISRKNFTVGFVGNFIHRKGPNRIIEAIEKLSDKRIQLICVGGNGNLKANSFTKIIRPVPNNQLPEIYNAFDVFVLPTLQEGNCNVIEEAKACCVPIISSKGTSVEEQIDESIGILVDPLKTEDIAKAISILKENEELRKAMVNNLKKKRGTNDITKRVEIINKILLKYKEMQST